MVMYHIYLYADHTLHYIKLHCIALHYTHNITLHYITLRYVTLHYIHIYLLLYLYLLYMYMYNYKIIIYANMPAIHAWTSVGWWVQPVQHEFFTGVSGAGCRVEPAQSQGNGTVSSWEAKNWGILGHSVCFFRSASSHRHANNINISKPI